MSNANIRATEAAFARVGEILDAKGLRGKQFLRVEVLGGGCSGFQYRFGLDENMQDDDVVMEHDGVKIAVDGTSLPFLEGSVIDYKDELIGARFAIENPNAASECGCGTSFSI